MSAKKKPARKTVTAWVFIRRFKREGWVIYPPLIGVPRSTIEHSRGVWKDIGYRVGPLTRIEVPLPEGK